MSLFGSPDVAPPELTTSQIAAALDEVKRDVRNKRIAMVAPLALAVAVIGAFVAAPARHGGLVLVPEADANDEVPRVFGANGVWRFAEPIGEPASTIAGPPWMVDFPSGPTSPDYELDPPAEPGEPSLSVSASSPPTPTLGQSAAVSELGPIVATDWSPFQPSIRVEATEAVETADSEVPSNDLSGNVDPDMPSAVTATLPADISPEASAPAEDATPPTISSIDEDVSERALPSSVASGDAADASAPVAADTESQSEANPSTPQTALIDPGTQPSSMVATIVPQSVLVHSAHVSVTVQVVDDDSSVIDWCNTRVDWGDGSVTGLTGPDGVAACAAECERGAAPSVVGINEMITFSHEYSIVMIDAAPRVYVATGDGCSYVLAEFQLNPFTVVPY